MKKYLPRYLKTEWNYQYFLKFSAVPNIDKSITSLQVTPFCCPVFKKFAQWKRENKQVPAKKDAVYTRWAHSLMTPKMYVLNKMKKSKHRPVSIHILFFSQNEKK